MSMLIEEKFEVHIKCGETNAKIRKMRKSSKKIEEKKIS